MSNSCSRIDSLAAPYVDGELADADRDAVERHTRLCPPCRARLAAERAARELVRNRRTDLAGDHAPADLTGRCAALRGHAVPVAATARGWWRRARAMVVAASLVLIVGAAFLYRATESSGRLLAAQLTADHVKCFIIADVTGQHDDAAEVHRAMEASFGWNVHLPADPAEAQLSLIGSRLCLYSGGRVAHIMYRYRGRPVSVFMLPRTSRPDQLVDVMGHEAAIWSTGDRTFVLIAAESRSDMARMVAFVRGALR
jgi:anti-sigma factor RsiW